MKIGIYIAYAPTFKPLSLKQEGLGRYMTILIKALSQTGNKITIACPRYCLDAFDELMDEHNISKNNIEIISTSTEPIIYKILQKRNKKRKKRKKNYAKYLESALDRFSNIIFTVKHILIFIPILLLALVGAIFVLAGMIIGGFVFLLYKAVRRVKYIFFVKYKTAIKQKKHGVDLQEKLLERAYGVRELLRMDSAKEIIKKISRMKEPVDIWYSPTAFWPEFNKINGAKAICAPDLVTIEFPINFSTSHLSYSTAAVRRTLESGTHFITYCTYIGERLLVEKLNKKRDNIVAIPHAINDMKQFVDIEKTFPKGLFKYDINHYFAGHLILREIFEKSVNMAGYLRIAETEWSIYDSRYIFYSSQIRGNKNIWNLVKAYEYILRTRYIPIKLILTCDITADKNLMYYIKQKRLQYDILCFKNVTNQQLAALYMEAELVVNPTLYEGGFPFTFGEGMSVGTPSIMSSIPQVSAEVDGFNLDDILFNPYDYRDIAEKIIYGLEHREELYQRQLPLYEKLNERSWNDVGNEYVEALKYFIQRSANKLA